MNVKDNEKINREISEIILTADGKLRCLFDPTAPIFNLSEVTEDLPPEKVRMKEAKKIEKLGQLICNTCCIPSSVKFLKWCDFCA